MSVNCSARSGGTIGRASLSFFNMKGCCVFSLELPHRGTPGFLGSFPRDSRTSSKQLWSTSHYCFEPLKIYCSRDKKSCHTNVHIILLREKVVLGNFSLCSAQTVFKNSIYGTAWRHFCNYSSLLRLLNVVPSFHVSH